MVPIETFEMARWEEEKEIWMKHVCWYDVVCESVSTKRFNRMHMLK